MDKKDQESFIYNIQFAICYLSFYCNSNESLGILPLILVLAFENEDHFQFQSSLKIVKTVYDR